MEGKRVSRRRRIFMVNFESLPPLLWIKLFFLLILYHPPQLKVHESSLLTLYLHENISFTCNRNLPRVFFFKFVHIEIFLKPKTSLVTHNPLCLGPRKRRIELHHVRDFLHLFFWKLKIHYDCYDWVNRRLQKTNKYIVFRNNKPKTEICK